MAEPEEVALASPGHPQRQLVIGLVNGQGVRFRWIAAEADVVEVVAFILSGCPFQHELEVD